MKYTEEQRLNIGREIYTGELTRYQAAEKYGIGEYTARTYMRMYRDANKLPAKRNGGYVRSSIVKPATTTEGSTLNEFEAMTKEELIQELIKARITEARLKKGYEVKGDGVVILYDSKSTK